MVAEFKVVGAFVSAGPLIGGRGAAAVWSLIRFLTQGRVANPLNRPMEVSAGIKVRENKRKHKEVLIQHDGTPKLL